MGTSNAQVAKLLRSVAAALTIKKDQGFKIRAYENAADSIEHSTSEIKDLWEEGRLGEVPGIGKSLQEHLNELFKTGEVKHFHSLMSGIEPVVFDLLDVPGVGPKTAQDLAKMGVKSLDDAKARLKSGELVSEGFSAKIGEKVLLGLMEAEQKTGRMLLPYASAQADKILEYLKKGPGVVKADPLGSLRRQVATIGDLDFAVASKEPEKVVKYFTQMPGVSRILNQGVNKGTVILNSGLQVDLLVGEPDSYGALLQHFTGGKNHNIHLRSYALKHGLSLNEDGVKQIKTGKVVPTKTEEEFYKLLKMDTPPPEIREDAGEIEAALAGELPDLVKLKDIKGDLHLHSNFPLEPSHGPGVNSLEEIVDKAKSLGYEFVGLSDHSPSFTNHTKEQIISLVEKRTKVIQQLQKSTKSTQILNGLEIDILGDGSLSVPDEALETLDYVIAGVHSGHRGEKGNLTKRILAALANAHVDIISHPTGRLLNERPSYEADWEEIFKFAAKNDKILEINAFPNRLDLRDDLVKVALKYGVKFVIDTDAHEISQMDNMKFGVSVARRGWVEKKDISNAWDWKKFSEWFKITS